MRWFLIALILSLIIVLLPISQDGQAASDFMIYSVYRNLDLGNSNEAPQKDYYVNIGTTQGMREGSVLEVVRRISTYDVMTQQLYKDMIFPVGQIKIIHAESTASIARIVKLFPSDQVPALTPRAIMVGDIVRPVEWNKSK